ncbi:carbohydrate ABC transporter permease [Paenibacillus sepulcri]|uniref:Sugar ABC transporter permease n=1 Tax=Paenibacillus sepulcri TaxID=359917 RepID=A0ABS7C5I8_9BACL|nr:sugar ABC transporter permease [Paenibacillus sepulcri]
MAEKTEILAGQPQMRQIKRKDWLKKNDWTGFLFVSPLVLGILIFAIYPMFAALLMSFKQVSGTGFGGTWVGLNNYNYILNDPIFWQSLYNTFYMGFLSVILGIMVSFILASMINSLKWGGAKNWYKGIFFLPNVISAVASSLLFTFMFFPTNQGIINYAFGFVGIDPVGWFTDPNYSRITIVLMSMWGALGYNTIIFIAGLQSVPRELYEAAEVDGASGLRRWFYITIPYLRSIFVFMLVMGTIQSMKRFTDVWLIGGTAGNPSGSLLTSVLYIYRNAFLANQMGMATAASYLLFIVIFILTVLLLRLNTKKDSLD